MKITFIRPRMTTGRSSDAMEPIVFGMLAALTPPGVELELFDERLEALPLDQPTDLVALTVETYTARRSYEIASHYLNRGISVVMGGCHPTLCPEEALRYATTIVIGDAEGVWPTLVEDARADNLQRVYEERFPSLESCTVDRSLFEAKRYRPIGLVQFGRGCRYACDFCSVHAFYGKSRRWRPTSRVIEEIRGLKQKLLVFCDDNLFNDQDHFEELLAALRHEKARWVCQVSLDVAADPRRVERMARAGCMAVMVGFESLEPANLGQMRKSWNLHHGAYEELISRFRRNGIMIYGGFVLGYDHDLVDAFERTLDFAIRNRLLLANFNPLTPTPGTPLYDRLQREGRLIHDRWWLSDDYRYGEVVFHPRGMSAEELAAGCYHARTVFNRWPNILRRMLDFRANCGSLNNAAAYLLANLTSRREIHGKQGRQLGECGPLTPYYSEAECQDALRCWSLPPEEVFAS